MAVSVVTVQFPLASSATQTEGILAPLCPVELGCPLCESRSSFLSHLWAVSGSLVLSSWPSIVLRFCCGSGDWIASRRLNCLLNRRRIYSPRRGGEYSRGDVEENRSSRSDPSEISDASSASPSASSSTPNPWSIARPCKIKLTWFA